MKILSGNSNEPFAKAVAAYLDTTLTKASFRRFSDNEIFVEIGENVRGEDCFIVQPTSYPANDHLMELLICIDALKRGSACRVTAVVPYFGYARQDRKTGARTPISAKLVANLISTAGADRVVTLDLHAGQIQGFFDVPVDNLYAAPVLARHVEHELRDDKVMIVSPDIGGVVRARSLARRLGLELAIIDKRRERANVSEVMNIIGNVGGHHCILIDDIVDSAGTLCNAARALIERGGAAKVSAYTTHGVLSGPALDRIADSPLETVVVTDSINNTDKIRKNSKIREVTVAPLIGEAILRICENRSVSSLFH